MTGQLSSVWPDIPEGLKPVMSHPPVEMTAPGETEEASRLVALDIAGTTLHEDGSISDAVAHPDVPIYIAAVDRQLD